MKLEVLNEIAKTPKKGSIVFIHGACHNAHCWENYLNYFSEAGYDCYALSLRGHGKSEGRDNLDKWGLSDYVTDVLKVILSIDEKPIIVGHSMGGAVVQKLIGEHEENLKAAVQLAPAVKGGLNIPWKFKLACKYPLGTFHFLRTLRKKDIKAKHIKNSLLLNNRLSPEAFKKLLPNIQVESRRAVRELGKEFTPYYGIKNIPIMVLGSKDDCFFPINCLEKNADAYGIKPVVLDGMCHDMMIDPEWKSGAIEIEKFLNGLNLKS